MDTFYIELIGTLAAILSTGSFLPQVFKTWRTKDTRSLSLPMVSMLFLGVCLWVIYGFLISSIPILISNAITCICAGILVLFKLKYK